jgi:glycine betaine/proline transport system ATP-binding protein
MSPGAGDPALASVAARATIAEAAPLFLNGTQSLRVTDEGGASLGVLRRDDVVGLMMQG